MAGSIPRSLVQGSALRVARRLLGARLVHRTEQGTLVGRIVETEAYLASGDAASHSAVRRTKRNDSMFLAAGTAYVYLSYGVHHCFNVVTGPQGRGEAVLVRALEPLEGLEQMRRQRRGRPDRELCDGPGKLTQAMGIGLQHDGTSLLTAPLLLAPRERRVPRARTCVGPRVGISAARELPLRFWLQDCPWVSRG